MRIRFTVLAAAVALLVLAFAVPASALGFGYDSQWSTDSHGADDIAVSAQGDVYAVFQDTNEVRRYNLSGGLIGSFGSDTLNGPRGVATDRFGRVYVADTDNGRVAVFSRQGDTIGFIAEPHGSYVYDVAVDFDSNVYLLDVGHTVQEFDADDWTHVSHSFLPGSNNVFAISSDLWSDLWFSLDAPGALPYTTGNKIVGLDRAHSLLANFGSTGSGNGQFDRPGQVGIDPMRRVYVADTNNNRVQVFATNGTWLASIGSLGSGDGELTTPRAAAPGWGREMYVADGGNRLIQKFTTTEPTVRTDIAGGNRIDTAVQAALAAYPNGCEQVLIATARDFPDALGGAALAGMLDAPILLTEPAALSPQARAAIGTLGATRAIILGSASAVGPDVETELNGMLTEPAVERIGGANRFETAEWLAEAAVANQRTSSDVAFVATGRNYPDALAAAPIAAANGWPIYLSDTHSIRPETLAAMHAAGIAKVHILGSTDAVGAEVETALDVSFGGTNVDRIGDTDRYRTAAALMEFGMRDFGMNLSHLAITTGQNYPDALAAGPLQAKTGSVILLTKKDSVPPILTSLPAAAAAVHEVRFLGDVNAISTPVRNQLGRYFW